ncbi:hypothetical protein Tco_0571478 [Tanacetum coccineum]
MSSITAQQTKLDLELFPKENRLDIGKCNGRIPHGLIPREPTFQVVLDAIALTPCYPAFLITVDVPKVYMHQFWNSVYKHDTFYRFNIDKKKRFKLTLEVFRDIFQICPRVPGRDFDPLPSEEDIVSFLRELGHTGEINSLNDVVSIRCINPGELLLLLSIGVYLERLVVLTSFVSPELKSFGEKSLSWRNKIGMHTSKDDYLINSLRFISAKESTQIYGAILPECLTSPAMKESKAYKTYLGYATGVVPPKMARKKMCSSSESLLLKQSPKSKEKEKVDVTRRKGIELLSEVALTEEAQMKEVRRRALRDFHKTHPSGSVTISTDTKETKVPVTSSSCSSDLASKFLNFSDIPHADAEIVSPLDVHNATSSFMLSEKLDWENPEGGDYPFDLSKPLPLITRGKRQRVPFEFFINNDLKYLQGGISTMTYTTSTTKTKAMKYDLPGIEDMVPNIWSPVKVAYDKYALWGISHWREQRKSFYAFARGMQSRGDVYSTKRILAITHVLVMRKHGYGYLEEIVVRRADNALYRFKEGDFPRLRINDIEDMLILVVQNRLTNLSGDDVAAFAKALRMFTRSLVIHKRIEDLQLGVESYQKKINVTKPDTTRPDLIKRHPYTPYKDPQGFIYVDEYKRNRLMRSDDMYKFSDGTLTRLLSSFEDITKNIDMEYLPKRRWSTLEKKRAHFMIKDINKLLKERRMMRSLEKFVGGRLYGTDLRLLQRTI